jgi:hypothetical protein
VTILEASYYPDTDTVTWRVELKNGDIYPMSWSRADYSKFVGVRGVIPTHVPDGQLLSMLDQHLETLKGKTNVTVIIENFPAKQHEIDPLRSHGV